MSVSAPSAPEQKASSGGRSVQTYIDETPIWADGTALQSTPMTAMQWRIWTLAAAGKFFEGLVVFMTGVAMPLIAEEFDITKMQHGMVGAASLFGILVGAIGLGGLSDYLGRKVMFIVEMIIFMIFLLLLVASPSYFWLVVFLFGLGVALGCDYPTAHLIISESIASRMRGRLVLAAFGFQALGALTGTVVGYLVLKNIPEIGAWRWMYATAIIPALIVTIGRFSIPESAHWLLVRGRHKDAQAQIARLLARKPPYPNHVELAQPVASKSARNIAALFNKANTLPVAFETSGEIAKELFGLVGVVHLPGLPQDAPHLRVHRFRQAIHDVAGLVYLTTLNGRVASKRRPDRLGKSLRAVDDEKARHGGIEAALDEIIDQRLHGRRVFRGALDQPERMLVAVHIDAKPCAPSTGVRWRRRWAPRVAPKARISVTSPSTARRCAPARMATAMRRMCCRRFARVCNPFSAMRPRAARAWRFLMH